MTQPNDQPIELIDSHTLAVALGVPLKTLDTWSHKGVGPKYIKVGRHRRYRWADVQTWLDENTHGGAL